MTITKQFAQGLGVTAVVAVSMFVGFTLQEGMLRERYKDFQVRVDTAVESALVEREKRVKKLEDEAALARGGGWK